MSARDEYRTKNAEVNNFDAKIAFEVTYKNL